MLKAVLVICRKNEEIDDKSMIRRLRKRIAELETQLSVVRHSTVRMRQFTFYVVACVK